MNKMHVTKTLLATLFAASAGVTLSAAATAEKTDTKPAATAAASTAAPAPAEKLVRILPGDALPKAVTDLTFIDRAAGNPNSTTAVKGMAALVHYTGWLYDPEQPEGKGAQFDTSTKNAAPYGFLLGTGRVIKGWELGVIGMKKGGKRTLLIPARLAYGERASPKIPANSTLIFDIEAVDLIVTEVSNVTSTATPIPAPLKHPVFLKSGEKLPVAVETLTIVDGVAGSGTLAEAGKPVSVHYTGWLYDAAKPDGKGNKFDSSVDRKTPFVFPLGAGRVIRGWDQGVAGMKIGGKRTLIIPPAMGYGSRGAGGVIPPNATLIFDVELLDVDPAPKAAPAAPASK